jgi:hypothetical protein
MDPDIKQRPPGQRGLVIGAPLLASLGAGRSGDHSPQQRKLLAGGWS